MAFKHEIRIVAIVCECVHEYFGGKACRSFE